MAHSLYWVLPVQHHRGAPDRYQAASVSELDDRRAQTLLTYIKRVRAFDQAAKNETREIQLEGGNVNLYARPERVLNSGATQPGDESLLRDALDQSSPVDLSPARHSNKDPAVSVNDTVLHVQPDGIYWSASLVPPFPHPNETAVDVQTALMPEWALLRHRLLTARTNELPELLDQYLTGQAPKKRFREVAQELSPFLGTEPSRNLLADAGQPTWSTLLDRAPADVRQVLLRKLGQANEHEMRVASQPEPT